MIDYLQNKFYEEAGDLITDLEQSLLELEDDPGSPLLIDRIFRALHTLKGSGAMFGYAVISDFTHHLENLYDDIRTQKTDLTREIMDLTLQSVDLIRKLLYAPEKEAVENEKTINIILERISSITGDPINPSRENTSGTLPEDEMNNLMERILYIRFKPGPDVLRTGNNPIFLLDELYGFGQVKVQISTHSIPDFKNLDVHACYVSWDLELKTSASISDIREVFLFVEDQSQIIISESPLGEHVPDVKTVNIPAATAEPSISQVVKTLEQAVQPSPSKTINTIRVSSLKLDQLMNLVSELVTMQARLDLLAISTENLEAVNLAEGMQKLSRQLRDITFEICMVPIQSIVTRFQRLVRDLSKDMKKEITFVTEGMETELDKNIIENIADPLLHIIRNCIDHGIESPEERILHGKPAQGTITLSAFHSGPHVIIEVSDDGAGINNDLVMRKAIQNGTMDANTVLSKNEIWELLFRPGFTTTSEVTTISGRGVGLDVVKQQVNLLRGSVSIKSESGKGTSFIIKLPLILSIIDGLLVSVADERFIIPLDLVSKIMVYKQEILAGAYQELIAYNGKKIAFLNLRKEFKLNPDTPDYSEIIVVNYNGQEVGLAVDKVIGEQQAVIKPLGQVFHSVNMFSGATILGDGEVALVLDIHKMIHELANDKTFLQ